MIKIDIILDRIYKRLDIKSDADFCKRYDIKPNTLSNWKARNSIPYDKIFEIIKNEKLSLDYIFTGKDETNSQYVKQAGYNIIALSHSASAGVKSDIEGIEVYDTNDKILYQVLFLNTLLMKIN